MTLYLSRFATIAYADEEDDTAAARKAEAMSLIQRFSAAWNMRQVEQALLVISPQFVDHAMPMEYAYGREGFLLACALIAQALAEVHVRVSDLLLAERGGVVAFLTFAAVQIGPYPGLPFSGHPQSVTWKAISVFRVERGLLVEHWDCTGIVPSA
jgi:predicted ester cyclase